MYALQQGSIEEQVCERSSCSHLCAYLSDNESTCFCDTSEKKSALHNGLCEGVTMLVTRGNHLFVVGLKGMFFDGLYTPIIRRTTLKSMDAVSAVAYDSIRGKSSG